MKLRPPAAKAVAQARPLPAELIIARAEVFNHLNLLDLNQTARRALFGILTFANLKNPQQDIWPARDLLRAESLLQSEATLYRGLKRLETAGYITRQQKHGWIDGKFMGSIIKLTEKAIVLLGLKKVIHKTPSSKVRGGFLYKEHSTEAQSLQKTVGEPKPLQKPKFDKKAGLPSDLVFLLDLGVIKSGVCKLMKLAKASGKFLSDVVTTVRHRIEEMRENEVYAYLLSMIGKPLDFAWIAKGKDAESAIGHEQKVLKSKLESLDTRYNGFEVVNENGNVIGIFEAASGGGTSYIRSERGSRPANLQFAKEVHEGIVYLRPAREIVDYA